MSLINVETFIDAEHPIQASKRMCDAVLRAIHERIDEIYAAYGAQSIPLETLLKGNVLVMHPAWAIFHLLRRSLLCLLETNNAWKIDSARVQSSTLSMSTTRHLGIDIPIPAVCILFSASHADAFPQ